MDDDRTLNLLGALALGLMDSLHQATASLGHGGETPAALITLGVEPGISINQLCQILGLSHPGTVRLIDRLETAGLVERRAGVDGRTIALFLTAAGETERHRLLAERRQHLLPALDCLSDTERNQLSQLLEKMLAAMTTDPLRAYALCRLCEEEVCPGDRCPVEQQYQQIKPE